MRAPKLLLALLLLTALAAPAMAGNHDVANDNGTTLPDAEESTERGPRNNDPVSWGQVAIIPLFMIGAAVVILVARRFRREDGGR